MFCPKSAWTAWHLEIAIVLTSFEQFHEETVDNEVKLRVYCTVSLKL